MWFYAFDEWWGTLAAILLCVPAGALFCLLPAMLVGTLRQAPIGDVILTWGAVVGVGRWWPPRSEMLAESAARRGHQDRASAGTFHTAVS